MAVRCCDGDLGFITCGSRLHSCCSTYVIWVPRWLCQLTKSRESVFLDRKRCTDAIGRCKSIPKVTGILPVAHYAHFLFYACSCPESSWCSLTNFILNDTLIQTCASWATGKHAQVNVSQFIPSGCSRSLIVSWSSGLVRLSILTIHYVDQPNDEMDILVNCVMLPKTYNWTFSVQCAVQES